MVINQDGGVAAQLIREEAGSLKSKQKKIEVAEAIVGFAKKKSEEISQKKIKALSILETKQNTRQLK